MEDQVRDEDTTANEDSENKCNGSNMATPAASSPRLMRGNPNRTRTDCTCVLKMAEVIVSTKPREVPCDRCRMKGRKCLP